MTQNIADHASATSTLDGIYRDVERYYAAKLRRFGATPLGVDWSCVPTQALRFHQLLKLCEFEAPFSLNDLGCGYGALLEYLDRYHPQAEIDYLGIDLSSAMVRKATRLWQRPYVRFQRDSQSSRSADYSIASGIFNVMLHHSLEDWESFIESTLRHLSATSRRGFAVNFVLPSKPGQRKRPGLYCTLPSRWISYCEASLHSRAALIEGYGMSEFTLHVRPA